jgi:hypothetical protein
MRHRHVPGEAPSGGGPDRVPRDPRHRPVVLHVAPRRTLFRHPPATLSVAVGFSLLLVSLLTVTLVSAWAGWRVAASGPGTSELALQPVVPQGTPAEPHGTGVEDVPVPGSAPAPDPAPAPVGEPVVEEAPAPRENGADRPTLPVVAAEPRMTFPVGRGSSPASTGTVATATVPPPEPDHSASGAAVTAEKAPAATAAPTRSATSGPPPATTPPATTPAATTPAATTPAATTPAAAAPVAADASQQRHCHGCSTAPGDAPPAARSLAESTERSTSRSQAGCPSSAAPVDAHRSDTRSTSAPKHHGQDKYGQDNQGQEHHAHEHPAQDNQGQDQHGHHGERKAPVSASGVAEP